jgi:hypothetical protein
MTVKNGCNLVLMLAATLLCVGCQRSAGFAIRVEGLTIPREYAASVDITNWRGGVQVYASDSYSAPEVRGRVRALNDSAPGSFEGLRDTVVARAVSAEENGRRTLRVTGQQRAGRDEAVSLDLQVRIPRAWGVRVNTTGGEVEVVGVSGPITIVNGGPGRDGGDVEVRTGMPITDPVNISTTEGSVLYQIGRGSKGVFDLRAAGGMPQVDAKVGSIDGMSYTAERWKGTLDGGTNLVRIESGKGDVRVLLIDNAGQYGKEYWDGWPQWPTSPRWIAKLAGD